MFITRSLLPIRQKRYWGQESVRLKLLIIVMLVLMQCNINCAGAPPKYLLESRANRYFEWYNYIFPYEFNNIFNLPNNTWDLSAWSLNMHESIMMTLKDIVKKMKPLPYYVDFSQCIVAVNESTRCYGTPKAYLRISTIAECNLSFMLCCPLYWVTDDQPANLPHRYVRPETFLWDGSKAINGFFTNFTEYDTRVDCSNLHAVEEVTLSAWKDFNQIAVDCNGTWALLGYWTKSALREIDVTDNATVIAEVNTAFGYNVSQEGTKPKQVFASISLTLAIVINAILLILMTIAMIVMYACCHYRAKKRVEERKNVFDNTKEIEIKEVTPVSHSQNEEVKAKAKAKARVRAKVNDTNKNVYVRNNSNTNNMVRKHSSNKYSNNNYKNSRHNSVPAMTTANAAALVETRAAGVDNNNISYQQEQICSQANANPLIKPEELVNADVDTSMLEEPMIYGAQNSNNVNSTLFAPENTNFSNAYERMDFVDQPFDVYYNTIENTKDNCQVEKFDLANFKKAPEIVGGADNFSTCANTADAPYAIDDENKMEVTRPKRRPSVTWRTNQYMY